MSITNPNNINVHISEYGVEIDDRNGEITNIKELDVEYVQSLGLDYQELSELNSEIVENYLTHDSVKDYFKNKKNLKTS